MVKNLKSFGLWGIILCGAAALPLSAQFRPAEIAQRESWEEFLRTAEIIKSEPEREGVTHPWKLTLRQSDVEHRAVWKDIDTVDGEIPDRWRFEVAAYRLDKLLDLNMIPPVVEREFRGKRGDLSLWADNKYSELKVEEENIPKPESVLAHWNDMKYLTRAWDCLIANDDRTQQNVLYTEDWRTILIDHSRTFRTEGPFAKTLAYGASGLKRAADGTPYTFPKLPRAFVEKLRALEVKSVKDAVKSHLTGREIQFLLARRDIILKEIDSLIRERGEAEVLY